VSVDGCHVHYAPVVEQHMNLYFGAYFWLRVVVAHLVPCSVLVLLNAALARTMTVARRRRTQLLRRRGGIHDRECRRLGDSIATTLMLVAVVGVLLLVELPLAVFLIIVIIENTWHRPLMADGLANSAALFINLLIVLSYPLNFFIYCGMSRQFRTTFAAMFSCSSSTTAAGLATTPAGTCNRGIAVAALPSDLARPAADGDGGVMRDEPVMDHQHQQPAVTVAVSSSSLLGRLRRSAASNNVRLHSVSLLGNTSPTDERQLDSGHL